MHTQKWPQYYTDSLILGNSESSVGIATLWTPKELFAKKLDPKTYKIIGQLYSNDGINPIIRNTWANPTIRTIILCGQERTESGKNFVEFMKTGKSRFLEQEIPEESAKQFVKEVKLIDCRGERNPAVIQKIITEQVTENTTPWAEPTLFPEPRITTEWYPSEQSIFTYRGRTVAEVWSKLLFGIMRFGEEKTSHHTSGKQKELANVSTVITYEDPDDIEYNSLFPFSPEQYIEYSKQLLTAFPAESLTYTYGMRLREHGHAKINQIETIIEKLKKEQWSRRALGVTWNVEEDNTSENPPCLLTVHAFIQYKKLFFTCYFRSNDMYRAWPLNTLALRAVQQEIAAGVGLSMGALTTIASSGHIYEENIPQIQQVIETLYPTVPCEQDPRGNYVIRVLEGEHIEVTHLSPQGRKIDQYTAKTAQELFQKIAYNQGVSVYIHALDLGAELQKAEIALRLGLEYTQDRPLTFST